MIEKKPFVKYDEDGKKADVISLKLNDAERELLQKAGMILHQEKVGSIVKSLMEIGYRSITTKENSYIIDTIFRNRKNNKRNGIVTFD